MGKASSSKKVARASRAAGRPGSGRNLAWPALLGGLVVLGLVLIVFSRGRTEDSVAPKLGDHWHAAYGIYLCDSFQPALNDVTSVDETGLHTHGDGLMHMHPFGTRYTGDGANIEHFGENVALEVTDTSFSVGGTELSNGDECDDGTEGTVQLKVWNGPDDAEGRLIESDFADYAPQEFSMWVLAFVPEGTEIPPPPPERIAALRAPSDVVPGESVPPQQTTPTATPADPTATTEPDATETTETTAPGTETTASTAPPATTGTTATTSP